MSRTELIAWIMLTNSNIMGITAKPSLLTVPCQAFGLLCAVALFYIAWKESK